jgi:hypothetical protein
MHPSFCTGFGGLVIPHQSAMTHKPTKGSFYNPSAWQDLEVSKIVGTFYNFNVQFRPNFTHPFLELRSSVATVDPHDSQPFELVQQRGEQRCCSLTFRNVRWCDFNTQQQTQCINQQMPLSALDPLGGVVSSSSRVWIRLNTLAIENGSSWPRTFSDGYANQCTEAINQIFPGIVGAPLTKNMINSSQASYRD